MIQYVECAAQLLLDRFVLQPPHVIFLREESDSEVIQFAQTISSTHLNVGEFLLDILVSRPISDALR